MSLQTPQVPIWDDNPGPVTDIWGFYTNDANFVADAPKFAKWAARRLGYPIVEVELSSGSFYAAFEQAINDYTAQVNQFNIRENILVAQGSPLTTELTQRNIKNTLGKIIQLSKAYSSEAGAGGNIDWKRGYITMQSGVQDYDLNEWAAVSASGKNIEIKQIYHYTPAAVSRFYDPFVETGLSQQNVLGTFGWQGLSTSVQYFLFPIYEDILRTQAIEFHDQVRRSAYSFELINNKLRIFPIPTTGNFAGDKLWFRYIHVDDRNLSTSGSSSGSLEDGVQSDYSNIQYQIIPYTNINQVGKTWIRKYALALAKETLGMVRSKYQSIPIPNAEVSLDGDTLRSEAQQEKEELITELRENLEESSRRNQLQRQQEEDEALQQKLKNVPLGIWLK